MTHRFHFRRLVWLGILSGLLLPAVAKAALLVSEPFAYPVGQVLNGQTGGTGFSGPWVEAESPPNDDIEADDLSRDSLAVSGNSLHSFSPSAVGTDLSRALATPIAGTAGSVLWCSFLIRKDSEGSSAGSNYCGLVLYPSNSSASALFIGDTGENDFYSLGIAGLASGQVASTQQSLVSATATFLVVKITFQSGADKIQLFINPDPSQPEPTVAAATKADLDLQDIGSVGILSGTDATWHLDEIRVGPDFAEVAPSTAVPTPTPDPTPTPSPSPSPSASPDPTPVTGDTLANISTRGRVEAGDNVLIGGFIIRGDQGKKVVIRAIGPSLQSAGVTGALADPTLTLFNSASVQFGANDNWVDLPEPQKQEVIDSTLAPTVDLESALLISLAPDRYTVVVSGVGGDTGVGLVEVFDLDSFSTTKLVNISTRGFVGTENNVLIGGFIVGGSQSEKVVVRAIGPSLTAAGVANALVDPTLQVFDGQGTVVAANNDWQDTQRTAIEETGLAPSEPKESATVDPLPPGNYTTIVAGAGGATGVGLVEVYNLGPP